MAIPSLHPLPPDPARARASIVSSPGDAEADGDRRAVPGLEAGRGAAGVGRAARGETMAERNRWLAEKEAEAADAEEQRALAALSDEELERLVIESSEFMKKAEAARGARSIQRWWASYVVYGGSPSQRWTGEIALFSSGKILLCNESGTIVDAKLFGDGDSVTVGDVIDFPYYRAVVGAKLDEGRGSALPKLGKTKPSSIEQADDARASEETKTVVGAKVPTTGGTSVAAGDKGEVSDRNQPSTVNWESSQASQEVRRRAIEENSKIVVLEQRLKPSLDQFVIAAAAAKSGVQGPVSNLFLSRMRRNSFGQKDATEAGTSSAATVQPPKSGDSDLSAGKKNGELQKIGSESQRRKGEQDTKRDTVLLIGPTSGGINWDGKTRPISEWVTSADVKGAWIWIEKGKTLSPHTLGFLASREEVRRFGGGARRITRTEVRLVDGMSFAQVVAGMFRREPQEGRGGREGRFPPKRTGEFVHGGGNGGQGGQRGEEFEHRDKRRGEERRWNGPRGPFQEDRYGGRHNLANIRGGGPMGGGQYPTEEEIQEEKRLRDKLAPVSLHSKIQRYGSVTNDQLQGTDHDDDQVQQMLTEMARLRRECNQLETSIRRHNGEDLSPLSEEELGNLQKQFESALGKVRERKDTLLKQQLDESRHRDELLNQQLGESRRRVRNLEEHGNFLRQMINENGHHRAAAEAPVVAAGGMPLPAKAFGGFFPWLEMAGSTSQQLPDF